VNLDGLGVIYPNLIAEFSKSMRQMLLEAYSRWDLAPIIHASRTFTLHGTQRSRRKLSMPYATSPLVKSSISCTYMVPIGHGNNVKQSFINGDFQCTCPACETEAAGKKKKEKKRLELFNLDQELALNALLGSHTSWEKGLKMAHKMAALQKSEGLLNRDLGVS